jgi:hypothetical protein
VALPCGGDSVRASDAIRELASVSNAAFKTQAAARSAAILANVHALAATSLGSPDDSANIYIHARRSLSSARDGAALPTTVAATSFGSANDSTITFNHAHRTLPSSPDAAELTTTVAATSFGSAHGTPEAETEDPLNFNLPTSYDVKGHDAEDDVHLIDNILVPLGFGLEEDSEMG